MYRKTCQNNELPEIGLYFAGRLNPENRRVKMTDLVSWAELEDFAEDRLFQQELFDPFTGEERRKK